MRKYKVIVCGTSFGQFYIEAIKKCSEKFVLAGILAKGSERSKICASFYEVPLYSSIDELPSDIDVACVVLRSGVMGGVGTDLSKDLLNNGINVIQEQPVHQRDVIECLKLARQKNLVYTVGNLYMHLPAIKCFLESSKNVFKEQNPLYVDASFATQVSYPMIQILVKLLSENRPVVIENVNRISAFSVITGKMGKTPFIFKVHNEINPNDPDNYLHFLHRMTVGTKGGSLILEDTNGSVLWMSRLNVPTKIDVLRKIEIDCPKNLNDDSITWLLYSEERKTKDIFLKDWVEAVILDIKFFVNMIEDKKLFVTNSQEIITVSGLWHEVTKAIGYPELNENETYEFLNTCIFDEIKLKYRKKYSKKLEVRK